MPLLFSTILFPGKDGYLVTYHAEKNFVLRTHDPIKLAT